MKSIAVAVASFTERRATTYARISGQKKISPGFGSDELPLLWLEDSQDLIRTPSYSSAESLPCKFGPQNRGDMVVPRRYIPLG